MTYRKDFTLPAELLEQVSKQGLDILPELIQVVINAAMQAERQQYLKAEPYQHTRRTGGARQRLQAEDGAYPGGQHHLLDPTGAGRRVLPGSVGERLAE